MAVTRVQTTPKVSINGSAILTFATPPAVGNGIVVAVAGWGVGGLPASTSDNYGNSYSTAITAANVNPRVGILYCPRIVATGSSFAVTLAGSGYKVAAAIEVTGLGGGALAVDQTATGTGTSAAPATPATAALTGSDVFAVGVFSIDAAQTSITVASVAPAWTQEFEELPNTNATGEADSRSRSSAAGTTEAISWTGTASQIWAAALAVFKGPAVAAVERVQPLWILPG